MLLQLGDADYGKIVVAPSREHIALMQKREVVMRNIKAVFAAIVMSVSAAGGAQAQSYDWSGFYVGGHVGYSWANSDYTFINAVGPENFSHDPSGWMGGAHLGLQKQWSNIVAGIEVSW